MSQPAAGRPRTAFVLPGGGSLGAIQVGMLQALYQAGIAPDILVATSVGALNAAFVASRAQSVATACALAQVWSSVRREDVFPVSMAALVGGLCGGRDHLVPDHGLRRLVRRHLQFDDLAAAPIPLHVAVRDVADGRQSMISRGPAADVIVAAASLPGIFPPVEVAGRRLVDAGAVDGMPIAHAIELGAERIYVLATHDPRHPPAHAPAGALDVALHALARLGHARFASELDRWSRDADVIVLPPPTSADVQPTNFEHSKRLISQAYSDAQTLLAQGPARRRLRLAR